MKEITVYYSSSGELPIHSLSTVQNMCRVHKSFDYKSFDYIGIVHTNNIDIGIIGINIVENKLEVRVFQSPNVCRMSILSLIDSSIYFVQSLVRPEQEVVFKDVSYAHTFKLQQIISDIMTNDNDYSTTGEKVLAVDMSQISLKTIILEKI